MTKDLRTQGLKVLWTRNLLPRMLHRMCIGKYALDLKPINSPLDPQTVTGKT